MEPSKVLKYVTKWHKNWLTQPSFEGKSTFAVLLIEAKLFFFSNFRERCASDTESFASKTDPSFVHFCPILRNKGQF
jgi:hypothetical protein